MLQTPVKNVLVEKHTFMRSRLDQQMSLQHCSSSVCNVGINQEKADPPDLMFAAFCLLLAMKGKTLPAASGRL